MSRLRFEGSNLNQAQVQLTAVVHSGHANMEGRCVSRIQDSGAVSASRDMVGQPNCQTRTEPAATENSGLNRHSFVSFLGPQEKNMWTERLMKSAKNTQKDTEHSMAINDSFT